MYMYVNRENVISKWGKPKDSYEKEFYHGKSKLGNGMVVGFLYTIKVRKIGCFSFPIATKLLLGLG